MPVITHAIAMDLKNAFDEKQIGRVNIMVGKMMSG